MALHNISKLLFVFFLSLLLPCHLAQSEDSLSLAPESSFESDSVPSPSPGPTSASSPSPGTATAPTPSSSPSPSPSPGPASEQTESSGPSPGPSPSPSPGPASEQTESSGPSPGPSPSPGPASEQTKSSGPSPGPSPSSGSAPGPSPSSDSAPGPSPSSGPAPGPSPSSGLAPGSSPSPGPSPSSGPAPGPSSDDDDIDDEVDQQDSISLPPSFSETPSPSMAPNPSADAPSDSDSPTEFDFSPTLAPTADIDPLVKKICDSTDYSSLCLATVSPYLGGKTDTSSVLDVAIQAGAQISKYGQETAKKLAGNPGNPPELASILNECTDSFESAVENFGKASDALPEHDKGTVNTMLSAVITYAGDCHDSISKESPLYNITDRLMNIASNCLAISSLMN